MKFTRKDYLKTNMVAALGLGLSLPVLQGCEGKEDKKRVFHRLGNISPARLKQVELK